MSDTPQHTNPEAAPSPGIPMGGLSANPQLLQLLGGLLGSASAAQEKGNVPGDAPQAPNADGLSALLSNPAVLEKLPQMMSVLGPMVQNAMQNATAPTSAQASPPLPPTPPSPSANRDQLLLSLKPFLSPRRCEAVDTMLRIAKLGTLFQQMK